MYRVITNFQITHCQLGLYPRADRYLAPFRLFPCVLLYYQIMTDEPTICSRCKACAMRVAHSNDTRAVTLNFFGFDKDDFVRIYISPR